VSGAPSRLLDRCVAALARLLLRAFFRQVELIGLERVPLGQPLLVVAAHVNSVADPLLLLAFLGVRPRMLAKHTLFRHPVMAPLLWLIRALPVYRRQDAPAQMARNFKSFGACVRVLADGGAVALFPEGVSHDDPHPRPLKTGAARLALEALRRHPTLPLRILPVGLVYEQKGRFRSRVLLEVGAPLDPHDFLAAPNPAAVRALTARIRVELDAVGVAFGTWDEARLVARAAAVFAGDPSGASVPLSRQASLWRWFGRVHGQLEQRDPRRFADLVARLERLDAHLSSARPAGTWSTHGAAPFAWLAPVGWILNYLPYQLVGALARGLPQAPNDRATFALLGGLLFFPLSWAAQAVLIGAFAGAWAGLAVAFAAPLFGWVALVALERREGQVHSRVGPVATPEAAAIVGQLRDEFEQLMAKEPDLGDERGDLHR